MLNNNWRHWTASVRSSTDYRTCRDGRVGCRGCWYETRSSCRHGTGRVAMRVNFEQLACRAPRSHSARARCRLLLSHFNSDSHATQTTPSPQAFLIFWQCRYCTGNCQGCKRSKRFHAATTRPRTTARDPRSRDHSAFFMPPGIDANQALRRRPVPLNELCRQPWSRQGRSTGSIRT